MAGEARPRPKSTSSGFEAEEDENDEDLENFIDGIVKELDAAEDGEDLAGLPDFKPDDLLGIGAVDGVVGAIGAITPPEVASPNSTIITGLADSAGGSSESNSAVKNNLKTVEETVKSDAQNTSSLPTSTSSSSTYNHPGINKSGNDTWRTEKLSPATLML